MIDVRRLLAIKAELETAMQGGIDPLMRVVMQRRLDVVCEEIEKAYAEWDKLFEQQELDQLRARVKEMERQLQEYKEDNVKLLRQCLKLYRALMTQRDEAEKVMETCAHNVWFSRLKERSTDA